MDAALNDAKGAVSTMQFSSRQKIDRVGPILYLRGHEGDRLLLAALVISRDGSAFPLQTAEGEVQPERIGERAGYHMVRHSFSLPCRGDAWYELEGIRYEVAADVGGDVRIAFVSCNGQECGDLDRPAEVRNAMWRRLAEQHRDRPFNLMIQGGDQIYADEMTRAHPISENWPKTYRETLADVEKEELRVALDRAFLDRYLEQMAQEYPAWLMARVPSVCMWDDHDICDGWGSLRERKLDSALGRLIFEVAREHFLLFQFGVGADEVPQICRDPSGNDLGWSVRLPGLAVIAPDLRSQRRPKRIMAETGWASIRAALGEAGPGKVLVLSTVPALGPRLSILERLMVLTPWMEQYEDDLRDQWQSRWHREEWQDFLRCLIEVHVQEGKSVTVVSGEIHLATRATMATPAGDLHQLIASGITHPAPPRAYAAALGAFARLGETPLPEHPIRMHALPGKRGIYIAERNFLVLERRDEAWSATWELEASGATPALAI
jgi:hypothetical protein